MACSLWEINDMAADCHVHKDGIWYLHLPPPLTLSHLQQSLIRWLEMCKKYGRPYNKQK